MVDESVPEVAAGVAVSSLGKAVAKVSKLAKISAVTLLSMSSQI